MHQSSWQVLVREPCGTLEYPQPETRERKTSPAQCTLSFFIRQECGPSLTLSSAVRYKLFTRLRYETLQLRCTFGEGLNQ